MKTDYTKHKDKRVNNPTIEERNFFVNEEQAPYNTLYPRDPSLDPQLVWKGKDEQDREDLAVPTVPIYIQEKIHPQAIIEDLKARSQESGVRGDSDQPALFGDFNGLDAEDELDRFQKQTEFYKHPKNWTNRMILGDSLMVLNSLAEKEGLKGKVQCMYIDPPYGIEFGSNWQVSTRKRQVQDRAQDATREPEQIRAFRDTWRLGIHSYLAYLRDRLSVALGLLTDSGSVFIQIGVDNLHLVRCVCDEVFGSENAVSVISFVTTSGFETETIGNVADYLVWYAKDKSQVKARTLYEDQPTVLGSGNATWLVKPDGSYRGVTAAEKRGEEKLPDGANLYNPGDLQSQGAASEPQPYEFQGKVYSPGSASHWKASYPVGMERLALAGRIHVAKNSIRYRRYASDFPYVARGNVWTDTITGNFTEDKIYVVQTNTKVIERCLCMTTDPGELVVDPTCGSGTTAFVAEGLGRRWITTDTSRVALALARTRLMAGKFPSYTLADSPEGIAKEGDLSGSLPPNHETSRDVSKGFVLRRAQHIKLEGISRNAAIRPGMTEAEINQAIARQADPEFFFDNAFEDANRTRVSGPFTVESLSPHRVLPASDDPATSQTTEVPADAGKLGDFFGMVIDNLKKAGVQNTKKGERLKFDDLQPYAGRWVNAKGTYETAEGKTIRVAVSVGPEYGAVSPMQIKEAAKEAMEGPGHDILVVCGYAFDSHVTEEAKHFGSLTVLPARMNADLAMGDDLLKKTGAGNLFMVFGEPDLEVRRADGQIVVELKGLDVFDPTTGVIRGGRAIVSDGYEQVKDATEDVACWFIDTDYNGESFFVRHAYFIGADKPYEKLAKTLRAEIDEAAWSTLYSTTSRPFPPPKTGKIAVKVINHYGDEVLKVYEL